MLRATRSWITLCSALVVTVGLGCGGKEQDKSAKPTGSGSPTPPPAVVIDASVAVVVDAAPPAIDAPAAATGALTPELTAVLDAIRPIMELSDADARSKAACKAHDDLNTKMNAVERHPPTGVDPAAWTAVAERMSGGLNDMAIECAEDGFTNAKALTNALEVANEFAPLIARPSP